MGEIGKYVPGGVWPILGRGELARRYGESPVAVLIPWGEGEIFHMISHYYLQRTEFRSARHAAKADGYYAEKGMAVPADLAADIDDLRVGDVESAAGSSRLVANVIAAKKRAASNAARVERTTARKQADR